MSSLTILGDRPQSKITWNRRPQLESALVRRREAQARHWSLRDEASNFFLQGHLETKRFSNLQSERVQRASMEAYQKTLSKEDKADRLQERRMRLRELLQAEEAQLEQEIMALKAPPDFETLDFLGHELKRREENALRREVELLEFQRWKATRPAIRECESQIRKEYSKQLWAQQMKEHMEQRKREEEEEERLREEREQLEQEEALRLEKEDRRREEKIAEWKKYLLLQIQELKERDKESEELQKEQNKFLEQQARLEEALQARKQAEFRRKNQELRVFWSRQAQAKLRQRAKEVQEEVEEAAKMLEQLLQEEMTWKEAQEEKKNRIREELLQARQALREQLEVEKKRQKDTEFLFQEEAEKMWKKREKEWEKEKIARQKLLDQVFAGLRQQISEKLQKSRREQEESLRCREELIWELEQHRKEIAEKEAELARRKEERGVQLWAQVEEKQKRKQEEAQVERLQEEARKKVEEVNLRMEEVEKNRMLRAGFQPKFWGFRHVPWF